MTIFCLRPFVNPGPGFLYVRLPFQLFNILGVIQVLTNSLKWLLKWLNEINSVMYYLFVNEYMLVIFLVTINIPMNHYWVNSISIKFSNKI